MKVELDPAPAAALDALHERDPRAAALLEECLDWLEADPVDARARRRQFTNGMLAMTRVAGDENWLIVWEEDPPGTAVVRFLGLSESLA